MMIAPGKQKTASIAAVADVYPKSAIRFEINGKEPANKSRTYNSCRY